MTRKEKALFFINSLQGGGAEKVVLNLCEALHKKGIGSVVVSLYKQNPNLPNYIENWCLNINPPNNPIASVLRMKNLEKILAKNSTWNIFISKYKNYQFKLITAHLPLSHKVAMCSPYNKHCIYVMHLSLSSVPSPFKTIHNKILKTHYNSKKISCVSKGVCSEFNEICGQFCKNVTTIYNPVNVPKITEAKKMHARPYMVAIGRLCKQKNQKHAIELYKNLNLSKNFDLIIIGMGPDKEKLNKLIHKCNLENNVFLKGFQSSVYKWIYNADLLISTSLFEGFSLVIAEALALNTPVISTDCKYGPSEILTDNLKDYIVPLNAPDSVWQHKIDKITNGKYPDISEKYISKFKPSVIIQEYIKYYEE